MSVPWTCKHFRVRAGTILVAFLLTLIVAAPAVAAPELRVEIQHTPETMPRNDEFLSYSAKIRNVALPNPKVGDELTCDGTPEDGISWLGNPAPSFTYQWLRSGERISGATLKTYTVTNEDEGKLLQCVITGTNQSTPVGRATTTAGSNILSEVITATGSGVLTAGSHEVTGVSGASGRFTYFQTITGPGIPPGTTIQSLDTAQGPPHVLFLSANATASGTQSIAAGPQPFDVGATVTGPGIPPGTTVTAVSGQTLTLSTNATASASGVEISGLYSPIGSSYSSLPPVFVSPASGSSPSGVSQPEINGQIEEGASVECIAPEGWSGHSISWSFQWLRDGKEIEGANNSVYVVQHGDVAPASTLQCEAVAEDAAGNKAIAISARRRTSPFPPLPYEDPSPGADPSVAFSNTTSGPVTLDFELPAGEETRVAKVSGSGWSCAIAAPSGEGFTTVSCSRADQLEPQAEFPALEIATTIGADAPDPAVSKATVSGGGSVPASTEDEFHFEAPTPFEITDFTTKVADAVGSNYSQAGGHPFSASADLDVSTHIRSDGTPGAVEHLRDAKTDLPPGFLGNAQAVPQRCGTAEEVLTDTFSHASCPRSSIVGGVTLRTEGASDPAFANLPVYVLKPEPGVPAQLEFAVHGAGAMYSLTPRLRPSEGYAISVDAPLAPKSPSLSGATATLCGFGTNVSDSFDTVKFASCKRANEPGANPIPFLTNPTECSQVALVTRLSVDSWEHPGVFETREALSPKITGCDKVPFSPTIGMQPTSHQADSPTGLDVSITMPTDGLESANGTSQSALMGSVVTLPEGMTVNPAAADGLGACSSDEIKLGTNDPVRCPDSSKIGSAQIKTPLIDGSFEGNVYLAKQGDNPFKSLLALYLVVESKERGILIKLPGRVSTSPSGRLTASFEDNPQVPFSSLQLHFNSGNRAPLLNPPACGRYDIRAELSPWSAADADNPSPAEIKISSSSFQITSGPGGGPCPTDPPVLDPHMDAGVTNPVAGVKTPFVFDLSREDGSQRFNALSVTMPPGLTGYLKGIPYCPESALAAIPILEGTGASQITAPSCPVASQLGSVSVGAGGGNSPFYVNSGRVYLAGPYKRAPLSLAIVTPAVAGPFDLGNVVIRSALRINPESTQITVVSDPIPTILDGIPLDVRDIRVNIDKPDFVLTPTNCEKMAVDATVGGAQGDSASVSNRFQVGECASLGFRPDLALKLRGGTKRNSTPALTATVSYPTGAYANIKRVSVALPHSEFLDQEHIKTVCTRVQFAANQCPKGSIYGRAEVTSPLLDYRLTGNVYLRSSANPLPDLVVALRGPAYQPVEIDLDGRIDSVNGGIRSTFETVPDAPVSKFILKMKGGKKGLLVNSRDLCRGTDRAIVKMDGQNGKAHNFKSLLTNDCMKEKRRKRRGISVR